MIPPFTGVAVALVTVFDSAGNVLVDDTAEHARVLAARGVKAIVVAGTTGEGPRLDAAERRRLLAAVRAATPSEVPVLAGTGHADADRALEFTMDAVGAAASGVLVHPADDADQAAFYRRIRAAAGEVLVLAYHFPRHYPGIPLEQLTALDVDGIKDSSGDQARLAAETAMPGRAVYTGSAALLTAAARHGAAGAILALANLVPELCAAALEGDDAAQIELLAHHDALSKGGVPALKAALADRSSLPAFTRV